MEKIQKSISGNRYYVINIATPKSFWLSTNKLKPPIPKEFMTSNGVFIPNAIEFTKKRTGEIYWRKKYAFIFTKVKLGKVIEVEETDDLIIDYLCVYMDTDEYKQRQDAAFKRTFKRVMKEYKKLYP